MMEGEDMVEEDNENNKNNSFEFLLHKKHEKSTLTTCKEQEVRTGPIMQISVCEANR
jgi:hypothetical protein